MIVVGLTGNYGMGKSTVAKMFGRRGAVILDTDEIVADLLNEASVIQEIREALGDGVVEHGVLSKETVARLVFDDPSMRIRLENILHPRVFARVDQALSELRSRPGPVIVVVEAPVLFERGYQNRFDKIVTVYTAEETAVSRLRDKGVPEDMALRRLKSQFGIDRKRGGSDYVIDNGRERDYTEKQVGEVYEALLAAERRGGSN
jgi:dephospho-CoA kinase